MRLTFSVVALMTVAAAVHAGSIFAGPLVQSGAAQSRKPTSLSQFPSADRVRAELTGADPMDTAARQMGAFWQLQQIVKELSGFRYVRNQLTPEERRLLGEYSAAYQAASQPYASYPDKPKWYQMHAFYETDDGLRNELFTRFLSPALLAEYTKTKGNIRATVQANRPPVPLPKPPEAAATAVLSVSSALGAPATSGNALGEKPLMLMKQSFGAFLKQQGMFQGPPGSSSNMSPLAAWAYGCLTGSPTCGQALSEAQDLFVVDARTDRTGKATFASVPPGRYYVFGYAPYASELLVWDLDVDLKAGANVVTLDQRNITPLTDKQVQLKAAASSGAASAPTASGLPPPVPRPSGPKNSTVSIRAAAVETFYLLDEDFELVLKRAGLQPQQVLGQQMPLVNSLEFVKRLKKLKEDPILNLLGADGFGGGSIVPFDVDGQYALGMRALSYHTVATVKSDASGSGTFPNVPAGTYYVYGTSEDFVKTGARGTITGNTVTLSDTGFNAVTIWNLKIAAKAGPNVVTLTRDNAASDPHPNR